VGKSLPALAGGAHVAPVHPLDLELNILEAAHGNVRPWGWRSGILAVFIIKTYMEQMIMNELQDGVK
jgi:hypothetical protein